MARFRQLVCASDPPDIDWDEIGPRGRLTGVLVETDAGELFPVTFYEPVRLAQDLEVSVQSGEPVLAETGMIVVPTLTPDAVEFAARMLCENGYFTHMRPITRAEIEASHPFEWPPRRKL